MKDKIEKYVGKVASIQTGGLEVQVTILDFKQSYGRERFLVSPVSGKGEVWVENVYIENAEKT